MFRLRGWALMAMLLMHVTTTAPRPVSEQTALFTILNSSEQDICRVSITPQTQNDHFQNLLETCNCKIPAGGSFQVQAVSGLYKVQIEGCHGEVILRREYIPVTGGYELQVTNADVSAKDCNPLLEMGSMFFLRAEYTEALGKLRSALSCYHAIPYAYGEGSALNNIAAIYSAIGRFGEAIDLYNQAERIALGLNDLHMQTAALSGRAYVYQQQGLYENSLTENEKALRIRKTMMDPAGVAILMNNRGLIQTDLGQLDAALKNYQEALEIERQQGNEATQASTLTNMGFVYQEQKLYPEAIAYFNEALALAQEKKLRDIESKILSGIGLVYAYQEQPEESLASFEQALEISRELGNPVVEGHILTSIADLQNKELKEYGEATKNYEAAMSKLESVRATAGSQEGRSGYIGQYANLYQNAVDLYHRQGQDETAFFTSERGRARSFLDSLSSHSIEFSDQGSEGVWSAESEVLSLPQIQSLLAEDVTLVAYYVLGENGSLAFIITRQSFKVVELPQATPENLYWKISELLAWPEPFPTALNELYNWIVAPLAGELKTRFVGIIPHQELHYVPFPALNNGQSYFGDQHILFEIPSASSLPFIQANAGKEAGSGALIFGNPSSDVPNLPNLIHSTDEARAIGELLNINPYLGSEASEARFKERASGKNIINLSGHGKYIQGDPLSSAMYLAPDPAGKEDGLLEVREIYKLDLSGVQLVALSACQSNLGKLSSGDELVGLTRALIFAGTPTVIASLWSVDDEATQVLMVSFYSHWLQDGMGKAQALQAAQADVRADPRWASPYYWAGFVLTGDTGPFNNQPIYKKAGALDITYLFYAAVPLLALTILVVVVFHWRRKRTS